MFERARLANITYVGEIWLSYLTSKRAHMHNLELKLNTAIIMVTLYVLGFPLGEEYTMLMQRTLRSNMPALGSHTDPTNPVARSAP